MNHRHDVESCREILGLDGIPSDSRRKIVPEIREVLGLAQNVHILEIQAPLPARNGW
jgi:hypothetical protein